MIEPQTVKLDAAELLALIRRRLRVEFDKGEKLALVDPHSKEVSYAAGMVAGIQAVRNIVRSLSTHRRSSRKGRVGK